jgi:hypothetical protein
MMLSLHLRSPVRIPQQLLLEGSAALKEARRGRFNYRLPNERRLRGQQQPRGGSKRRNDAAPSGKGHKVALRELAISIKKWAQSEQMMGRNYPSHPQFDAGLIRTVFGQAGLPAVTRILQDRMIAGIGINELTDEIVIFTRKRLRNPDIRALSQAAVTIGGTRISLVFRNGGMPFAGANPPPPTGVPAAWLHNDRYACGSSIYIGSEKGAGTLGCLVRSPDGTLYGLSNNHITGGCNYAVPGLPIVSPGSLDVAAGAQDPETIGHHSRAYPFVDGLPEIVDAIHNLDAAIFKITNPDRVSSMQRDAYDTPDVCVPLEVGMRVQKVGRTTGSRHGEVVAEYPDCEPIEYELHIIGGKKQVYFQGMFIITASPSDFAQPGDSGALIVEVQQNGPRRAVGIVVGTDGTGLCYALSLHRVLEHFDVALVSNHNV